MQVRPHKLFQRFMAGLEAEPEASVVHSLAEPPTLGDFLEDLDPALSLDWSGKSFYGMPTLRQHILDRTGTAQRCCIDNVLITAGAAEANFLAISQLVQPGDEVIVDVPGWPQPLVLAQAVGANVQRLERREKDAWRFDLNELEDMVSEQTRLIFICHPNNPTGQLMSDAEISAVVEIARRHDSYILCDEVYAGLEWNGQPISRIANLYEKGISTGSVSKALGLQGLRTGWMISQDKNLLFDAMVLREDTSEIMNIMGEAIAEIALREDRYNLAIDKARRQGQANLKMLDAWITSRSELSWQAPAAGLIGFCHLNAPFSADDFAQHLAAAPYQTFVMPGSAYDHPQHLRLGVGGGEKARLPDALQRMGRCLDDLASQSAGGRL